MALLYGCAGRAGRVTATKRWFPSRAVIGFDFVCSGGADAAPVSGAPGGAARSAALAAPPGVSPRAAGDAAGRGHRRAAADADADADAAFAAGAGVGAPPQQRGQCAGPPADHRVVLNMYSLQTATIGNCYQIFSGDSPNPTDPVRCSRRRAPRCDVGRVAGDPARRCDWRAGGQQHKRPLLAGGQRIPGGAPAGRPRTGFSAPRLHVVARQE